MHVKYCEYYVVPLLTYVVIAMGKERIFFSVCFPLKSVKPSSSSGRKEKR